MGNGHSWLRASTSGRRALAAVAAGRVKLTVRVAGRSRVILSKRWLQSA